MIKSMTGFGRGEAADEFRKITVEVKAVNHRYLDFTIKMPKRFNLFESRIRKLMKEYAERGKMDIFVSLEDYSEENLALHYNATLAAKYMEYMKEMSESLGIPNDMTVSKLASMQEVFMMKQQDEDEESLWPLLEQALRMAGQAFADQKAAEGARLAADIVSKLDGMEKSVAIIEEKSPATVSAYRQRLEDKIREVLENQNIDQDRLMTEAAIYADKVCVDEETVRLKAHIKAMKESLSGNSTEGVGRKLDFLAQEMNREANTTLSKCSDMDISAIAISLKTEIEKIREQVQNIE